MKLLEELRSKYTSKIAAPFLISREKSLLPIDVLTEDKELIAATHPGDVVALIGDFDATSISRLLTLIQRQCILVPLTDSTRSQHNYFFEAACVDVVVSGTTIERLTRDRSAPPVLTALRECGHPGLILFSSGSTGLPKAILHDFVQFLARFRTPRPTLKTLSFLLFDHIGGINTLFHTLFNLGSIVQPSGRKVQNIVNDIKDFAVELLPTTPTFLRMMLLGEACDAKQMPSLKIITYGTERMDEQSLKQLCASLPKVDFRQTYGMSELGILRAKSVARDSLWMSIGGEGVETKIIDGVLKIRSATRMMGYLNAPSPFDSEGWYDTRDVVEERQDGTIRVTGRLTDWINVGGEKILPSFIESMVLRHPDIFLAKAIGAPNPITGQHIELTVQPREGCVLDKTKLKAWLKEALPASFQPQRLKIENVSVSHRFKQL